jgi:UPF0755 protein
MSQGLHRLRGRSRLVGVLALVVLAALGAAALRAYLWIEHEYQAPGPATAASRIQVEPGTNLRVVLAHLQAAGSLRSARAVEWYLRLHRLRPRVQAGEYEIAPLASPAQIIAMFEEGKVVLEQVTVVEGATFGEFLNELAQHPRVLHTLAGKSPDQVMAALGHPGVHAEGEFFPDTYRFAGNTPDAVILGLAYERMQKELDAAWQVRSPQLPFDSPYQALILASMVEKEAALKSERPLIAGVFVNRLRRGMRLQSDPTVIYGLGASYDGSIHTHDLLADNPYNSYTRAGLPPTPIALPGQASLLAAVQPAKSEALYFVASGLNDGAHHFSSTLEEHNSAVKTYLARLREQERATAQKPQPSAAHPSVPPITPPARQAAPHP